MAYKGSDISAWQGDINIKTLASQIDFFIFRGYAGSSKDKKVDRNVNLAIESGKPYGLYIYSYALNVGQAKEEAQRMVTLANSYSIKPTFLCIDMEDADGYKAKYGMPSNQTIHDMCIEACKIFENGGYKAVVYASSSWFNGKIGSVSPYEKWVAHWPVSNGKQKGNATSSDGENANNCAIWQFTSEGTLNGYSGRLDMNYAYKDFVVKGYNTSSNKQQTKTNEEIANEVIAGKWGNGDDRKSRLENAGYDYNTIQAIVNQKLSGTTSQPAKKSNETIAQEVINGVWGNGEDRKNKLTQAGYDYNAIQSIVNQKLGAGSVSNKKSNETIANEVIQGKWGNGADRKSKLTAAGYDYNTIQAIVNKKLK